MSNDLYQIAARLSGAHGVFPVTGLVKYGDGTVIIKPGAQTDQGHVIHGAHASSVLGDAWQVFPMGVEYGPSRDQILGVFDNDDTEDDLGALEEELDEDAYGAKGAKVAERLRKRYLRVVARFRKCQTMLQAQAGTSKAASLLVPTEEPFGATGGKKAARQGRRSLKRTSRCNRKYRRMLKIWHKMQRKGLSRAGLPSPDSVRNEILRDAGRVAKAAWTRPPAYAPETRWYPQAAPMAAPGYPPAPRRDNSLYHADQAALEREMAQLMPSYGDDLDAELAADVRAEARGFVDGHEHDHFGGSDEDDFEIVMEGNADEILARYGIEAEDELGLDDDFGLDDDDDDDDFGNAELDAMADEDGHPGVTSALDEADALLDDDDAEEAPALEPEEARALNRKRAEVARRVAEPSPDDRRVLPQLASLLSSIDKVLQAGSKNVGIDYGRLRPKLRRGRRGVVVIAVRPRRAPVKDSIAADVRGYVSDTPHRPGDPQLLDVFAADLYRSAREDTTGEALDRIYRHIHPHDTMYGDDEFYEEEGSVNAYPFGDAAPVLPPRTAGPEVR